MKSITDQVLEIIEEQREEIDKLTDDKMFRHMSYNIGNLSWFEVIDLGLKDEIQIEIRRVKNIDKEDDKK